MEISKKEILHETHYGLNIYAHILRNYYPGETVLSLSGRDCQPAKNPFNCNKPTLKITIIDNCARHIDSENAIPAGDIFDFAQLHYKLEDNELLKKINEDLHLHIGEQNQLHYRSEKAKRLETECRKQQKIEVPEFSYFKRPVSNIIQAKTINLIEVYDLLRSNTFVNSTSKLRTCTEKEEARNFKSVSFDYVTFSGTFTKRADKELIKHSGLLTVDFDHVSEIPELKQKLLADDFFETELLFISPSGDGLKWIIPIDISEISHQDFFKAVAAYILKTYYVKVDNSGKDISRACFLPFDPEAYINPIYLNTSKL
ncbi:MAG: VirE protein [Draconibacterium sp.]|nr:VirE protein [Draconibacterium sp.]